MPTFTRHAIHSPKRSLAKTVTWRALAAVDTFAISLVVTGSFAWAGSIVGIEAITKMLFYYMHERIWGHVRWGVAEVEH
jgi:uncharacterized membrane protein